MEINYATFSFKVILRSFQLKNFDNDGKIKYTVKPLVQSPPKRQQFCKIHEGDWTRGTNFTKK